MKKRSLTLVTLCMGLLMAFSFAGCNQNTGNVSDKTPLDNTDDTVVQSIHFVKAPAETDQPGPGDNPDTPGDQPVEKVVNKIAIKKNPDQVEYWKGDTMSVEGGVITVTYKDKSTEDISMTADGITVGTVNMNVAAVSKAVKITYSGKSAQFYIKVKEIGGSVTFDMNYEGGAKTQANYEANKTIPEPSTPERKGFTFDQWYTDQGCTIAYDFNKVNTGSVTLYASWKDDSKSYVDFTYDLNYYGIARQTYNQLVAKGESSRELGMTPTRGEFVFDGWFTDAACTSAYKQGAVSGATTVYAKWKKTKSGTSTYKFEAENCYMGDQEGPGLSGSAGGGAMMVVARNEGISGKVISYLYKEGIHVDFGVACSEDATATLKVYVASEFSFNLNSSMYKMKLTNSANADGVELSYAAVDLKDGAPVTCITIQNVALKEGYNVISLITANSANPTGVEGSGTYKGTAPMIDCIELETSAVVIWDGTKGLPVQN